MVKLENSEYYPGQKEELGFMYVVRKVIGIMRLGTFWPQNGRRGLFPGCTVQDGKKQNGELASSI
jgi:hypothetical protein